ncbi:unnamed protein product [Parascedosporium putredinis]|uniref:Uncharacterized protein n=1 Tax=Parascedosporium putredinis TaxID=1442378 RepID=A0A9P1GWA5_9PEZI|nr:unnamed protein product [Parascedosporium putredinis]CAI7988658.1 unnamed protein product [Parascedosporium putredinis]
MAKHAELGLPAETLTSGVIRQFLQGLAQDVINVLGRTQQPIQNTVVFDGDRMEAQMYALHPPSELGTRTNGATKSEGVAANSGVATVEIED